MALSVYLFIEENQLQNPSSQVDASHTAFRRQEVPLTISAVYLLIIN